MPEPWEIIASRHLGSFRVFDLHEDLARSPRTGLVQGFYVLRSPDWVGVLPLTPEGKVVMVRQYRHGSREVTLELPGGLVDVGDTPEGAARRELEEETGYTCGELLLLGTVSPQPALMANRYYPYLAREVRPHGPQRLEEAEDIEVVLVPLPEVPQLIAEGAIAHSLVICTFYLFLARCGEFRSWLGDFLESLP